MRKHNTKKRGGGYVYCILCMRESMYFYMYIYIKTRAGSSSLDSQHKPLKVILGTQDDKSKEHLIMSTTCCVFLAAPQSQELQHVLYRPTWHLHLASHLPFGQAVQKFRRGAQGGQLHLGCSQVASFCWTAGNNKKHGRARLLAQA